MSDPVSAAELLAEAPFRPLADRLRSFGSLVVAYSGGVDSTFLLVLARAALGERALGVLARSESLDRTEYEEAVALAGRLGLAIAVVDTHEYDRPEYRRNDADRCYFCKAELFSVAKGYAERHGYACVADGSHAGDVGDFRPGLRARDEAGVVSPLLECGIGKEAIREASRRLGLPTWDKPAAPCLASRIPYGSAVTDTKLRAVERAEGVLRALGFREVRVRHHGDVARVEVPTARLGELLAEPVRAEAIAGVRAAGFQYVTIDLEGFRSGSLHRARLAESAATRGTAE